MDDLQREFNRRTLQLLERALGVEPADRDLVELRELLLTMELTDKLRPPPGAAPKPAPPAIDWWRLMPLLLTLALILAAVVASLLGVELGSLL